MCSFRGNQLKQNVEEWRKIGASSEVIDWISNGIKIPFQRVPAQFSFPNRVFKRHESYFIRSEIKRLLISECIREVDTQPLGISPISVVPKKNGEFRLILDLRHLNSYCTKQSVIYEDIKTVIGVIEPEDPMITTNIKNGFH